MSSAGILPMVSGIQKIVSELVGHALAPFGMLSGLVIISLVSGIVLVAIYGKLSFQKQVKAVKQKIHAAVLEVVLFRHNPVLSLRAQSGLLWGGVKYLLLAIPPVLLLAIPVTLLLSELGSWFEFQGVSVGSPAIVEAALDGNQSAEGVQFTTDPSVNVVGPLRDIANHKLTWRIEPQREGSFPMVVTVPGGKALTTQLYVGNGFARIQKRVSDLLSDRMFYPVPGESHLSESQIVRFEVGYPKRELSVWGYTPNWMVLFFILSLVSGLIGGKLFGIEL